MNTDLKISTTVTTPDGKKFALSKPLKPTWLA